MAPRPPASLLSPLLPRCSCPPRLAPRKFSRELSTSPSPSTHRIVAAALLSRPPLTLPPLTPFESTYYAYQRRLHRALNKPLDSSLDWFFKKGSAAEKSFVTVEQRLAAETGEEAPRTSLEIAREGIEGREMVRDVAEEGKEEGRRSLERRMERTVYLLLKKDRAENAWQFRESFPMVFGWHEEKELTPSGVAAQGGVESGESLLGAAQRELIEETGPNMDVWALGRAPAGAYAYPFPKEHTAKFPEHEGAKVRPSVYSVSPSPCPGS